MSPRKRFDLHFLYPCKSIIIIDYSLSRGFWLHYLIHALHLPVPPYACTVIPKRKYNDKWVIIDLFWSKIATPSDPFFFSSSVRYIIVALLADLSPSRRTNYVGSVVISDLKFYSRNSLARSAQALLCKLLRPLCKTILYCLSNDVSSSRELLKNTT